MESIINGKKYSTSKSKDEQWLSGENISVYFRDDCDDLGIVVNKDITKGNHVLHVTKNRNFFLLLRYSLFGFGNKIAPVSQRNVRRYLEFNQSKEAKKWLEKYFGFEDA